MFPNVDSIEKIVERINDNEEFLKSYTIDIMVGFSAIALIEVHNFTSVGLYNTTISGECLCCAYKQGIEYLIHDNKSLEI